MTLPLLYLIGEPGSGKSTLMAEVLVELGAKQALVARLPFAHTRWQAEDGSLLAIELGYRRESFSGTDALPMNVQPTVKRWLLHRRPDVPIVAEGDRLANGRFFQLAEKLMGLTVVLVDVPYEVALARREARTEQLGSEPQDPAWVKGRATKTAHLADLWGAHRVDGRQPAEENAVRVLQLWGASIPEHWRCPNCGQRCSCAPPYRGLQHQPCGLGLRAT